MSEVGREAAQVNIVCRAGTQIRHHRGWCKGGLVAAGMGPCKRLVTCACHSWQVSQTVFVQPQVQYCN